MNPLPSIKEILSLVLQQERQVNSVQTNSQDSTSEDSNSHPDTSSKTPHTETDTNSKFQSIWILDSGACDHICPHLHYFSTYKRRYPIPFRLPYDNILLANFSGTITSNFLSDYLMITFSFPHFSILFSFCLQIKHFSLM